MASSTPEPALIALFFSQSPLDAQTWNAISLKAITLLTDIFALPRSTSNPPQTRYLSSSPPTSGYVLELTLPTPHLPTLPLCAHHTLSPPLQTLQTTHKIQMVLQPSTIYTAHRIPGLALFDMDSTLIQQEIIDELARAVGRYDQVAAITEAAMRGEPPYATDFTASLRARVALLRGVPGTIWGELKADVVTFTPGARELVGVLRTLGWRTAVVSGGFLPLATWVKEELGLDFAFANSLAVEDGTGALTGELVPGAMVVDGPMKRELLLKLAGECGVRIENVLAVGDGSNDLPMMGAAGLGIAFNAKPKVQLAAPSRLNGESLMDVMHVLGYSSEEIEALTPTGTSG